jgi:hypothetical protein
MDSTTSKGDAGPTQFRRMVNNVMIGLFVPFISQPFEVIRTSSIISLDKKGSGTRAKSTQKKNVNFRGMAHTINDIYKQEGFQGFYRGGSFALLKGAMGYVFFFTGLENIRGWTQQFFQNKHVSPFTKTMINFFNASAARVLTTVLLNPIVILKTRCEVLGSQNGSMSQAFSSFYRQNGLRGFMSGLVPTLMKDVPYSGLQYSFYRALLDMLGYKKTKEEKQADPYNKLKVSTAAFMSAVGAIMLTYPFDNIRVRFQCDDMTRGSDGIVPKHRMQILKDVWHHEGIKGFYHGYLPRIARKGFNAVLCWILYETLQQNNYSY